jgi:hypothetical protein
MTRNKEERKRKEDEKKGGREEGGREDTVYEDYVVLLFGNFDHCLRTCLSSILFFLFYSTFKVHGNFFPALCFLIFKNCIYSLK